MNETKIQLRARILQEISKLKSIPAVCDRDIEAAISNLSQIENKTFLCTLILKEIDGSVVYFDGILGILAIHLTLDVLEKCVFTFLEKPNVKDEKKLFLINLLTQAGIAVEPNLIHLYVKNVDEMIDLETEKFLKMAELNPEAQIDFLDFYYGIQKRDADILLDSIIEDYSGDMLANILAPLIYSLRDDVSIETCISGLLKSRSYLAYAPLDWLIKSSDNPKIVSLARKTRNELKIAGLRKEISTLEYYKELFKGSKPLGAYVSSIDGASNFSFVFAREYQNGAISTFFTVFNLECGPVSCFGLANISRNEYEEVLHRFFKDTEKIPLSPVFAYALVEELADFGMKKIKAGVEVPYEFFCWRQLMYDIEPLGEPVSSFMEKELQPFCNLDVSKITDNDIKRALDSEYGMKWFYPASKEKYPEFCNLIDKIIALKESEFEKLDEITLNFLTECFDKSKVVPIFENLKKRFLFEAYFLKCLDFKNLSSLFYSIYLSAKTSKDNIEANFNQTAFEKFFEFAIKRSVYEFFLSYEENRKTILKSAFGAGFAENIFLKKRKNENFDFNSKKMLELIEAKWTK